MRKILFVLCLCRLFATQAQAAPATFTQRSNVIVVSSSNTGYRVANVYSELRYTSVVLLIHPDGRETTISWPHEELAADHVNSRGDFVGYLIRRYARGEPYISSFVYALNGQEPVRLEGAGEARINDNGRIFIINSKTGPLHSMQSRPRPTRNCIRLSHRRDMPSDQLRRSCRKTGSWCRFRTEKRRAISSSKLMER